MTAGSAKMWVTRSGLESRPIGQPCREGDRMTRTSVHRMDARTLERFLAKFAALDEAQGGCWQWSAHLHPTGYAHFTGVGDSYLAHRVSYQHFVGPIPEGYELDHLCRNRGCVNPDHLEPVTKSENVLRSPIHSAALNRAKTHCLNGHPFEGDNLRIKPGPNGRPKRYCLACRAMWRRADRARRRDAS